MSRTARRTALATTVLAAAVVLGATVLGGSPATAGRSSDAAPAASPTYGRAAASPAVTERGIAVEGSGSAAGYTVFVSLYENSTYGVHPDVTVETPDGRTLGRDPDASVPASLFLDGTVSGVVALVERDDEHGSSPAGNATVSGSYTVSGRPTKVHETVRDDGFVIVTRGTTTPVTAELVVQVDGVTVPVSVDVAFAFDNTTLRQPIGNG